MNGAQDLGGRGGFGPVEPEADEPVFHADWERRVLALNVAMGATGAWTIDAFRHARERMTPAKYLASSYYEIWLHGLETLLVERGLATVAELEAGSLSAPPAPVARMLRAADVGLALAKGWPAERPGAEVARHAPGDRVVTRLEIAAGHRRLPDYLRGRPGVVDAVRGRHVLPDSSAHFQGEAPTFLYSVRFAGADVFGAAADPGQEIFADLWETYLAPA
ncbi:nitrile hydratase subunit beta [Methylopila sp. M107]|uniref:nitrile hydratase subunit beta n=1 Tax=Methylopila sp. M107 TaxID=1101190 RepID=UPI000362D611|nr:nitrile hydratase subunit beta [Methylopila sp. M107]